MRPVALIAAAQTPFGDAPALSIKELFAAAFRDLLRSVDRGIELEQIQAAYIGSLGIGGFQLGLSASLLCSYVGLAGIPAMRVENACASSGYALLNAIYDVSSGAHDVVLAGGVEKMGDLSSLRTRYWLGVSGDTEYERLAGLTFAGVYALMAQRYFEESPLARKHLAMIAVKNHLNGELNPKAHFRQRVSLDQALRGPMVAEPLGLFDCCPVSDGAAAVLVVAAERAREFTDRPVHVIGFGAANDHVGLFDRPSLTSLPASVRAAHVAFEMAGLRPSDVDVAEVHDCFTIAEVLAYEDLGFCERGQAYREIEAGTFSLDGRLPINASGGLKAKGHPIGATGIGQTCEIFHQLLGTTDRPERQVRSAEVGLSHNVGGSGGAAVVFIYGVSP
jgi:acetyl-CoA acetyltransferase